MTNMLVSRQQSQPRFFVETDTQPPPPPPSLPQPIDVELADVELEGCRRLGVVFDLPRLLLAFVLVSVGYLGVALSLPRVLRVTERS